MTLQEWATSWPYAVRQHPNGLFWTPDTTIMEDHRRKAFRLSDVFVSGVTGGSLWFAPRMD